MQIELTVRTRGVATDVAICARRATTLSDVLPALQSALGLERGVDLWRGSQRLMGSTPLGARGLRTGDVLDAPGPGPSPPVPAVLALHRVGGPDAGGAVPVARGRLVIGREPTCDVVVADLDTSRRHAVLDIDSSVVSLHDCGSANGTRVDGVAVGPDGVDLAPGQSIRVGDSTLTLRGPVDVPAVLSAADDGSRRLSRPPRDLPALLRGELVLPHRPTSTRPRGVQWVAAVVPAVVGAAIAWFAHSPQFLLFALLSPVMLMSTSVGDRLHWRRSRRRDTAGYRQRCAAAEVAVAEGLVRERRARTRAAPDAAAIAATAVLPGSRLWERRRGDADLLDLRLGIAPAPSTLQVRDGPALRPAGVLRDVAFTVALRAGPVGVCGPPDVVDGLARWLVCQVAALHAPCDVAVSLLLGPGAEARWQWARWLPHLRGRVATRADDWLSLLSALSADLAPGDDARTDDARRDGPWQVLVVDRAIDVADVAGLRTLLAGRHTGVSAICVATDEASLPTSCATVVRVSGATGTRAKVRRADELDGLPERGTEVVLDTVAVPYAERLARELASITLAGADGTDTLPDSCTLLAAVGAADADAIRARWDRCDGGARTVVGIGVDGPLMFDLVRDGPHALVAGTTGAGKSEFLRTLVAGLAATHPPESASFLLIDYKGGAAFGDCARLPHTAGLVTDLDGYSTERALRSLTSELRRRERLLADREAIDLAAYRGDATAPPLPRLVIVVDEFAALADELPDFVSGLIAVAQRGRSLGVHLVLATQRPRSAVSAEIRANSALRVALRVTDASESSDVIDAADAAAIDARLPGRAYLRSGDTLTCFQAAHAGSPVAGEDAVTVRLLDEWRRPPPTSPADSGTVELTTLVDAVRDAARRSRRRAAASPWLPGLPDAVATTDLPPAGHRAVLRVAVVDLPDEQRRTTLDLDLRHGPSLVIAGAPRSGRSCALAALALEAAARYAPDELHVYVVDAGGALRSALAPLPHVATHLCGGDPAPVLTLLRRLAERCADPDPMPQSAAQLLLIDSWDMLTEAGDADAAECADLLTALLRVAPAAGLTIVVTGGRGCLTPRVAANFGTRVLLALADRNDYALAGLGARAVPRTFPPGRGLRADDGAVLQIVHAGSAPGLAAAGAAAVTVAERWSDRGPGTAHPAPIRIRPLPRQVRAAQLRYDGVLGSRASITVLGVGGDAAEPVGVDLFAGARQWIVAGPPRSGRSTVLRSMLDQVSRAGVPVVVAAGARSPLAAAASARQLVDPHDTADAVGPPPAGAAVLLVDDLDLFADTAAGEALLSWIRTSDSELAVVVAGRPDDFATSYRGIGAHLRRSGCGLLLRPGPIDGEILGVRLPRRPRSGPPGRGVLIGDPAWGGLFRTGEPVPLQVALPDAMDPAVAGQPMCG